MKFCEGMYKFGVDGQATELVEMSLLLPKDTVT
jgi:hypothetical protein